MAYAFATANSRSLSTASAPASGSPMTIACWFNPSLAQSAAIVSVGVSSGTHRNQLQAAPISGSTGVNAVSVGATAAVNSVGATAISNNTWAHGAAVFASATSRTAYTNGIAATANAENCGTQNAANSIVIGARWSTTLGLYYSGSIAEVGVWNVALTASEIASLAKGVTCDHVRPDNLVFYAPLIRDLIDKIGGLTVTNNNSATVATHTRVYA